jgi:hypothetical protein
VITTGQCEPYLLLNHPLVIEVAGMHADPGRLDILSLEEQYSTAAMVVTRQ